MEFNEKIQLLRRERGLTQEELAEALYVSRTAISKWESGRGYPSIDSLKLIANLFSVPVDNLLSGDKLISLASIEQKTRITNTQDLMFGILDCMAALLFFLPFFGQENGGIIETVPLVAFTDTVDYVWLTFVSVIGATACFGIVQLSLQNWKNRIWKKCKIWISIALSVFALMFTIASRHPYPGAFLLCLLVLKGLLIWKSR